MRIVPLEIGRLDTDYRVITGGDGSVMLPVPAWLIEHPDGLVLFDTGLHADLVHDHGRIGSTAKRFRPDFGEHETLASRLTEHGIRPGDVDVVVLSHLHFDHVGGTAEIPDARLVVQADEWAAGHDAHNVEVGLYDPTNYDVGHDVQPVDGVHDLFGDGRVRCLPTPGHTVGHQSLIVELDSGPVVLTSDCCYFERFLDEMVVPRFGFNLDQQRASMTELARLRSAGHRLIFGHDEAQFRALPTAGMI